MYSPTSTNKQASKNVLVSEVPLPGVEVRVEVIYRDGVVAPSKNVSAAIKRASANILALLPE